ncbi:hypothetical protein ACWV27_26360 (plasmid) [Massilia varians]
MPRNAFIPPVTAPLIIGVAVEVTRAAAALTTEISCWHVPRQRGTAMNDATLDWNQFFHQVAADATVTAATVTLVFNHTLRVCLPVPPAGRGAALTSVGDLVALMVQMMKASGEFAPATAQNELIFYVAALARLKTPAPQGRKRALVSEPAAEPMQLLTADEWKREKERQRKRQYYLDNSERIIDNVVRYKQANPDKVLEHIRNYNNRHRKEINTKATQYYWNNKETINRKRREQYAAKSKAPVPVET